MKITSLSENTTRNNNLRTEHGMCLYIETKKHKILIDTGASDIFFTNAGVLGIDIGKVDIVIITHGHYDHGGGLKTFLQHNKTAKVYVQESAFNDHYHKISLFNKKNIGIGSGLKFHPQVSLVKGDYKIDDEIMLINNPFGGVCVPTVNKTFFEKNKVMEKDSFSHEQSVIITEHGTAPVLVAGCAHRGIVNIIRDAEFKLDMPIETCVSGFHTMHEKPAFVKTLGKELKGWPTVKFYTFHCTSHKAFNVLQDYVKDLNYLACGDTIEI